MLNNPSHSVRQRHVAAIIALLLLAGLISYVTLYARWISGTTAFHL